MLKELRTLRADKARLDTLEAKTILGEGAGIQVSALDGWGVMEWHGEVSLRDWIDSIDEETPDAARPTKTEKARAILHHVTDYTIGQWLDGNGWYYVSEDYPDEGSVGAFLTREKAVAHGEAAEYFFDPSPTETATDGEG